MGDARGAPNLARLRALAAIYFWELSRRGLGGLRHLEAFAHPDALEALAAHHGHPTRLMDGEPLPPRS